jgi:ATP-dependent RNA helicase RhlE
MGFIPDIKRILALLPKERQSLLFSATFSDEIKKLADTMLKAPQLIEVAKRNTVSETITHRMHPVATDLKRSLLTWLIQHNDLQQALVFCGTKFGASRIASYLNKQGITADAIHGDKSQNERTKALEAFKAGTIRILVATDVAARGIDIDELPTVINYELPHTAEDYVHRIGRTGRAGKKGEATSLVAPEESGRLADIEKLIKLKIERVTIDGFEQSATRHPEERSDSKRERSGRGERTERRDAQAQGERGERRHRRPEQDMPRRIPHMDAASAHLPKLDFDPTKPYESRSNATATAADQSRSPAVPARSRKAPVAALLGGFKPKV